MYTSPPSKGVPACHLRRGAGGSFGWVSKTNSAILVHTVPDPNRNLLEVLRPGARLSGGGVATSGFEALQNLAGSGTEQLTPSNPAWGTLQLWIDDNANGTVDPGELVPLSSAGVQSISLTPRSKLQTDRFGNVSRFRSTFTRTVGGTTKTLPVFDTQFLKSPNPVSTTR